MDRELSLIEHLNELRKRIVVSLVTLVAATLLGFGFAPHLLRIFKQPVSGIIEKLAYFSPQEPFLVYTRIAFFCGLVIAMPVILYQLWQFISPALEVKARRFAVYFILFSFAAFAAGALFGYFILIPPALRFLLGFARGDLEPVISVSKYISFVVSLILSCGLVFQMPVLSFILTRLRVVNARALRRKYRYAVAGVFIVAAVITPTTDVFNMLILACPMLLLYEISIWVSYFTWRTAGEETPK